MGDLQALPFNQEVKEQQFIHILNSIPGMVAYVDVELRFVYANKAYAGSFGKSPEDLIGQTATTFFSLDEFDSIYSHIQGALRGEEQQFIKQRITSYGSRTMEFVYSPDKSVDGTVKGLTIFINDITHIKSVEKELERKTFELQDYVDNASVGLHWVNSDGIIIWANKADLDMLGYKEHEYIGKHISEFHVNAETISDILSRLSTKETLNKYEASLRCKDGSTRFVQISSNVLWENDNFIHTRCFTIDVTNEKALYSALEDSERHYRTLIEALPSALYTCDLEGRIAFYNKAAVTLWGREPEYGKDLWSGALQIFTPEGEPLPAEDSPMAAALKTGIPVKGKEVVFLRPDGEKRTVLPHPEPIFDTSGKLTGAINMLVDITEIKLAREIISESESRFRTIADHAPMLIWMADEEGHSEFINQTFLDFIGKSDKSEFDNKSWIDFVHPDDFEPVIGRYRDAFAKQEPYTSEFRLKNAKTGEYCWYFTKGIPRYFANGNFAGYLATALDINERKATEKYILKSVEHIHFLTDTMPQKVWTASPEGLVTYMNAPWVEYSGISVGEFKENGWACITHPDDLEACDTKWQNSVKSGELFENEHRFRREDGEFRWHLSRSIPQRNEQGRIVLWVGTDTDIDDKKRTEEELILANKIAEYSLLKRDKALRELMETKRKVEEIMRVKEQFLSNMSHEIRTPMNAIIGFTDLILNTGLSSEQKQFTDAIKTSGENLLVIINDILDFSKLEAGAITFEKIQFKLPQILATMTDLMLPKSIEKNIKLSVILDKRIPEQLIGDPTRLNQILLNLVGNAIKFTESGEVRTIIDLVDEDENEIELKFSVNDTGIGIPEEKLLTIFEPFTQATSDTTRKYGGSGLGLSIVRQFVERQGGSVSVESNVGEGSTFSFLLRFAKDFQPPVPVNTMLDTFENDTYLVQGLNILLVEDNEMNQILATKVLTGWNWNVELAENGKIAVEKIRTMDFDLVLMDIQLPEMDGYEATRRVRTTLKAPKCSMPIMAMTAHAMQSEERKCYEAGMDGYISKPFSSKVLYSRIVTILNSVENPNTRLKGKNPTQHKK
ncbi:MAG: PAS domain S-box protein [Bacteroidia bacterium]